METDSYYDAEKLGIPNYPLDQYDVNPASYEHDNDRQRVVYLHPEDQPE